MAEDTFFYLGLSLLTMHEMDAIRCREWRIFPILSMLSDKAGYIVFVFAHIPLFFFIFYQLTYNQDPEGFRTTHWFTVLASKRSNVIGVA